MDYLDKEQAGTDKIMERFSNQLKSNLHSTNFWTRAFTVLGHYMMANIALSVSVILFAVVVNFIVQLIG